MNNRDGTNRTDQLRTAASACGSNEKRAFANAYLEIVLVLNEMVIVFELERPDRARAPSFTEHKYDFEDEYENAMELATNAKR